MAFHVTLKSNLENILKKGLLPCIGPRSMELGESKAAVYLFINIEECENALLNWLGEEFEDIEEDLVILEIDNRNWLPQKDSEGNDFFEIVVEDTIYPEYIIRAFEENYEEISLND